jgi:pimeloyl-ACP methyl ester carboxylesterase
MRSFQKVLQDLKVMVASQRPGDALTPPESMQSIEVNGLRLSYVTAGADRDPDIPPVVLLHGFGGFFMDWPRVMAPISRHTRVYAIDLPGWGFSEPSPKPGSLEDEVEVVNEFLSRMGLSRVILCGISYGAGVAWAAAATNLPRVSQVLLLNPMPPHPMRYLHSPIYRGIFLMNSFRLTNSIGHRLMSKAQYKLICRENLLNDRLLDTFYLDLAYMVIKQPKMPTMLAKHAHGARTLNWDDWEHRLAGIRVPVTIMQGLNDRIFSMASARYLHRAIPTSQLIEVPDCGHAMVFDQHRKVSDFIIRQLAASAPTQDHHEHLEEDLRRKRG